MDEYRTVAAEEQAEQTMKNSRFIARIAPVTRESAAMDYVGGIRKAFRDATHHCYAFSLFSNHTGRYSDDGEPAGTAGLPIFNLLQKQKLDDCVIVVTRYFGGTLLGTGGLVRAYGSSAALVVSRAKVVVMKKSVTLEVRLPYAYLDALQSALTRCPYIQVQQVTYLDTVTMRLAVLENQRQKAVGKISEITQRKAAISQINQGYLPWES